MRKYLVVWKLFYNFAITKIPSSPQNKRVPPRLGDALVPAELCHRTYGAMLLRQQAIALVPTEQCFHAYRAMLLGKWSYAFARSSQRCGRYTQNIKK